MKKIATLVPSWVILLATLATPPPADASDCARRIVFLPQSHVSIFEKTTDQADLMKVARSQFQIATYIQANPSLAVFSEQVDENLTSANIVGDLKIVSDQMKRLFPSGIPARFDDLSNEQKTKLAQAGADGVLLLTGRIAKLYKVVPNRQVQDEIFAKIRSGLEREAVNGRISENSETYQLLMTVRERLALTEIRDHFASHPTEKTAVLIYGRNHDFKRHDDVFPGRCIEVPPGF